MSKEEAAKARKTLCKHAKDTKARKTLCKHAKDTERKKKEAPKNIEQSCRYAKLQDQTCHEKANMTQQQKGRSR
jgi:hypothetical protein